MRGVKTRDSDVEILENESNVFAISCTTSNLIQFQRGSKINLKEKHAKIYIKKKKKTKC